MTVSNDDMVAIAGGTFTMGSNDHYPEEGPARAVQVDDFRIDACPVSNRDFAAFVAATGYVTFAERAPNPADYPGAPPEMLRAGSLLFQQPQRLRQQDWGQWWDYAFGVDWRTPQGPGSDARDLADHPVVHIAFEDAQAYADWAGKRLPTEAEWEYAARGGLTGQEYAWGDMLTPDGRYLANFWQGDFPVENRLDDGFARTSPVRAYPANGYGLYDMIGNVWEWTGDYFAHPIVDPNKSCCIPKNPRGATLEQSYDPADPIRIPRRVLKGGSHLCAANYCQRYRPAARYAQPEDTSTSHVGFRCVSRA